MYKKKYKHSVNKTDMIWTRTKNDGFIIDEEMIDIIENGKVDPESDPLSLNVIENVETEKSVKSNKKKKTSKREITENINFLKFNTKANSSGSLNGMQSDSVRKLKKVDTKKRRFNNDGYDFVTTNIDPLSKSVKKEIAGQKIKKKGIKNDPKKRTDYGKHVNLKSKSDTNSFALSHVKKKINNGNNFEYSKKYKYEPTLTNRKKIFKKKGFFCTECDFATDVFAAFFNHKKLHYDSEEESLNESSETSSKKRLNKEDLNGYASKKYKRDIKNNNTDKKNNIYVVKKNSIEGFINSDKIVSKENTQKSYRNSSKSLKSTSGTKKLYDSMKAEYLDDEPEVKNVKNILKSDYECKQCPYVTDDRKEFAEHELSHLNLSCDDCEFKTSSYNILNHHKKRHSKITCDRCNYTCKRSATMKVHKMTHGNVDNSLTCTLCDLSCDSKKDLKKHILCHTEFNMYPSENFSSKFEDESSLETRYKEHCKNDSEEEIMILIVGSDHDTDLDSNKGNKVTKNLNKSTNDVNYYEHHSEYEENIDTYHKERIESDSIATDENSASDDEFDTDEDPSDEETEYAKGHKFDKEIKTANIRQNCTENSNDTDEIIHDNSDFNKMKCESSLDNDEPFLGINKCKYCPFTCEAYYQFKEHEESHADDIFTCDLCDYSTDSYALFKKHKIKHKSRKYLLKVREHEIVSPYKCFLCDYVCKRKSELKSHVFTHTKSLPYS